MGRMPDQYRRIALCLLRSELPLGVTQTRGGVQDRGQKRCNAGTDESNLPVRPSRRIR